MALDVRRLAGVGIRQEKRAAVLGAGTAPIPWLALSCRAMAHNIRTWTVGAVQDWDHHDATLVSEGSLPLFLFSRRADQHLWNTFHNLLSVKRFHEALAGDIYKCSL